MQKWTMILMVMLAVGCARTTARAQQPPTPEPAEPAQPFAAQDAREQALQAERQAVAAKRLAEVHARAAAQQAEGGRGFARAFSSGKKEKVAWLGLVTSPVSGALRKQVKLSHKGIGLTIERVEPKSPADEAGLQQYDILEKLDDQWLVNSQQFGVLVRMHKPGDEVTLSVVREGQPLTLKAKLVEKEMRVNDDEIGWMGAVPGEAPEVFQFTPSGVAGFNFDVPAMDAMTLFELDNLGDNATITVNDGEHTLKITRKDGKKNLEASDKDGVVVFSGPIDTDEERDAVPQEIQEKLNKFRNFPRTVNIRRSTTAPSGRGIK